MEGLGPEISVARQTPSHSESKKRDETKEKSYCNDTPATSRDSKYEYGQLACSSQDRSYSCQKMVHTPKVPIDCHGQIHVGTFSHGVERKVKTTHDISRGKEGSHY